MNCRDTNGRTRVRGQQIVTFLSAARQDSLVEIATEIHVWFVIDFCDYALNFNSLI